MIVGLAGYARAGKDTVGRILTEDHGFARVAFADALKAVALDTNPFVLPGVRLKEVVRQYGWDEAKQKVPEVRVLLQHLGVAARDHVDPLVWVRAVERRIQDLGDVAITDVRFPNEAEWVRGSGGFNVRIHRPGIEAANGHVSELALDDFQFDAFIVNAELDELPHSVEVLVAALRAREHGA